MRIATFNVNGIKPRLEILKRWLAERSPDIVCLQELKCTDANFPHQELKKVGYSSIWHGQSRWNGVAILSKGEIVETRRGLPNDPDPSQSRYIEAAVQGIIIGCLYAPNGNPRPGPKFEYKLAWLDRFAAHASDIRVLPAPVVLMGDFNIIPTAMDAYKPERWKDDALFAPEARQLYAEIVRSGWKDGLLLKSQSEHPFTFWHYWRRSFERDAGIRIDHALLNGRATRQLKSAVVDREPRGWDHPSDHAPVLIELKT